MKKIMLILSVWLGVAACNKREVLPTQSQLDTANPELNSTDQWVMENLTVPYNIELRYKWDEWNLPNMGKYNYPTTPGHAAIMAKVLKHTWLDAYVETAGADFIKHNSPRQFTLFGGVDLTPNGGPGAWGQASGGVNVLLFQVSALDDRDLTDVGSLQAYSGLMHHEYTHILNQNVPFDEENFQKITPEGYTANYHLIPEEVSRQEGFISSYARMNIMEDFAEMTSSMLTRNRQQWDAFVEQEVVRYTQQRDNAVPQREAMRNDLEYFSQIVDLLGPELSGYPNEFGAGDEQRLETYYREVFLPIFEAADPILAFLYTNWQSDYNSGNQITYNVLLELVGVTNNPNFRLSPSLMREFVRIMTSSALPYLERRFDQSDDLDVLSSILARVEKAKVGRDKIRMKERFVVDYFKSKLNIDLYALQAASYGKLSTPITADPSNGQASAALSPQASATSQSIVPYHEVRHQLMNSRFHVCSWEKQSGAAHSH